MKMKSPFMHHVSIALTDGTSVAVAPEGSEVPMKYFQAAVNAGCLPLEEEQTPKKANNVQKTNDDLLRQTLISMLEEDNGDDFRDDGLPKLEVVIEKLGMNIEANEMIAAFNKLQEEANAETELETLRAEAKALKVKSPHLIKNIDTLKAKIAEAKAGK